jgi:phage protein D
MIPYFSISGGSSGGQVIDSANDRFISVTIVDNAGFINDRLSFTIDDRPSEDGSYAKIPVRGDKLTVQMGYQGKNSYNIEGMVPMGEFIVDEIECEFSPETIIINAHASDTNGRFKEARSKSWHKKKIKDIVEDCAQYSGMSAAVHKSLKDVEIRHEDQVSQSCAEFLRVFADRNDAVMKVQAGRILFGPKNKLHEVEGADEIIRPKVTIKKTDMLQGRYVSQGKAKYVAVKATFQTPDQKNTYATTRITIQDAIKRENGDTSEGNTGPTAVYSIPGVFANESEAKQACLTKMKQLALSECGLGFACIGNPKIVAETEVTLEGIRPGIQKKWIAIRVTHTFDSSGFRSEIECESPEKEPEKEE